MKIVKALCVAAAVIGVGSPAFASTTIGFGTPSGNLGATHTYTKDGFQIIASGFDASNRATALWGKNGGGDEIGLGLKNDPSGDHEIYFGKGYVQIDVRSVLGKVSDISFFTNSTTQGEQWSIFGSNIAGSYSGAALLSGTNEFSAFLPQLGDWDYYDFVSTANKGGKNFLIGGLTLTAGVPEPAAWSLMILGFGAVGAGLRRRKPRVALTFA